MEFQFFFIGLVVVLGLVAAAPAVRNGNGAPVTVFAGQPVPATSLGSPRPKKVRFVTRNGRLMTARVVTDRDGRAILRRPGHSDGPTFRRFVVDLSRPESPPKLLPGLPPHPFFPESNGKYLLSSLHLSFK